MRLLKSYRCGFLLLILAGSIAACWYPDDARAQVLPFRHYSIEHGLSESVVYDMMQDNKGYIWVATNYGLNRFDGITFQNYFREHGLNDNNVYSIYQDKRGRIFIGTDQGINLFIPKQDTLVAVPALHSLNDSRILCIYQDNNGNFWFGTDGQGVWYYNSDEFRNRQAIGKPRDSVRNPGIGHLEQYSTVHGVAGDRVRDITQDSAGTIWFGTRQGLTSLSHGNFRTYTSGNGLPENKIRDLHIGVDGALYIATRGGLAIYNNGTFSSITENDGLINNRLRSISGDHKGGYWLGTEGGVSYYHDGKFRNYDVSEGLANQIVYTTLYDREHNIWFGTFGGGISYFMGERFRNFSVEEGLPNNVVTSITTSPQGDTWIATYGGGIARYNGKRLDTINTADGLIDNKVYALHTDRRNRIWIGTRWGLSIYDNGQFRNFARQELPYRKIRTIHEDRDGQTFWLGTYGEGIIRYKNDTFKQIEEKHGLANNTVMDITQSGNGELYIATYGGLSVKKEDEFTTYTVNDGLPNNGVLDLNLDNRGYVWIATFGGVAVYDGKRFVSITKQTGLPDDVCYFVTSTGDFTYWIGTNKGMVKLQLQRDIDPLMALEQGSYEMKLYTKTQGLISNETNAGAVYTAPDGHLWIGTVGGASEYLPEHDTHPSVSPKIYLKEIQVFDKTYRANKRLTLNSGDNYLRFHYAGLSFSAPEQITYAYRLRNAESDWHYTTERSIRYAALTPGLYTFEIRAKDWRGNWSRETATSKFEILAPIWQRWWFLSLLMLMVAAVIYFIYHYYRVRKMVDIERMRVQIASDLHDDVGGSLTEIALQTDFLRETDLNEEVKQTLKQIGNQSRNVVNSLDDIVWTIDARNDTVGDLTDRMQDYVNHVLQNKNIEVRYNFGELDADEKLPVEVRENVYLVFKEAVNNVAKHSSADRLEITFQTGNKDFTLIVDDNGQTKEDRRRSGHGLRNMQMRAERIGAKLNIDDNDGFTITLKGSL